MATIRSFEDLLAWQKSRELTRRIYEITREGKLGQDSGLGRQMQRAAVSIMSNIAEGHERASAGDFYRFLMIAKGSCAELRAQLYVALDAGYLSQPTFDDLLDRASEVGRIIGGLAASVKKRR